MIKLNKNCKANVSINKCVESVSTGLIDGGCDFVSNYPGFFSQDIFFSMNGDCISSNERVAFQRAYGVALSGKRSCLTIKGVGLNSCADEFLHAIINGVNAGMVIILTEDVEAAQSPESQDSRIYIDFFGGLIFEPSSNSEAYYYCKEAFQISEKLDIPVIVRLTNDNFRCVDEIEKIFSPKNLDYITDKSIANLNRDKYIGNWSVRSNILKEKKKKIDSYVSKLHSLTNSHKINPKNEGVIVRGVCKYYSKYLRKNNVDIIKILTYPAPAKALKKFCLTHKKITVLENGSGVLLNEVRKTACISNILTPQIIEPQNSIKPYNGLLDMFEALKKAKPTIVIGDQGMYTYDSSGVIRLCLCLGSSVGIVLGMAESGVDFPISIVGDAAFLHGGFNSLLEAKERKCRMGVIIIDNGGAVSTGGQKLTTNLKKLITTNFKNDTIFVNYSELNDWDELIRNFIKSDKLSIIYVKQ